MPELSYEAWLKERKRAALAAITAQQKPNCPMSRHRSF